MPSDMFSITAPVSLCSEIHCQSLSILEAFTTNIYSSGEKRYTRRSSTIPPRPLGIQVYCILPSKSLDASLVVSFCINGRAPEPLILNSPMCEQSNPPTAERTVSCSALTPWYCTGISHPAKGTILAPSERCMEFNAVFLRTVFSASIIYSLLYYSIFCKQGFYCFISALKMMFHFSVNNQ